MIEVVPATLEHAARMAPHMRREDAEEVRALGLSPHNGLLHSLDGSFLAEAALAGDEVAAMWGACAETLAGNKAFVWMLGTDHVPRNAKALLRGSRSFVAHVHQFYPVLECLVDVRYYQAISWVRWLGFRQVAVVSAPNTSFALCQKEV